MRAADGTATLMPDSPLDDGGLQELECLAVAVEPLPLDAPDAQLPDHGMAAPLLALVDRRQVNLDRRDGRELERVADRVGVVRPRTRVEQQAVGPLGGDVQALAELALVVCLPEGGVELQLARELLDPHLELGEREVAVVLGVAASDLVEVHAVHHVHAVPPHRASELLDGGLQVRGRDLVAGT